MSDFKYEGQFKKGKFQGKGILHEPQTSGTLEQKYEGNFLNGQVHGYGIKLHFDEHPSQYDNTYFSGLAEYEVGEFKDGKCIKGKFIYHHRHITEIDKSKKN